MGSVSSKGYGIALEQFDLDLEKYSPEDINRVVRELSALKGVRKVESNHEQGNILVLSSLTRESLQTKIEEAGITVCIEEAMPEENLHKQRVDGVKEKEESKEILIALLPDREFLWLAIASFILGLSFAFIPSFLLAGLLLLGIGVFSLVFLGLRRFLNYYRAWDYAGGILAGITLIGALSLSIWAEVIATLLIVAISFFLLKWLIVSMTQKVGLIKEIIPQQVLVGEDSLVKVNATEITPGQLVWVDSGERIPLDGVIEVGACSVDESLYKGTDVPVSKGIGDRVYAGGLLEDGQIALRVENALPQSRFLSLLDSVQGYLTQSNGTFPQIEKWSKRLSLILLYVALAVIVVPPLFMGGSMQVCLHKGLALLLAATPWTFLFIGSAVNKSGIMAGMKKGIVAKADHFFNLIKTTKFIFFEPGVLIHRMPKLAETVVFQDVDQRILNQLIYIAEVPEGSMPVEKETIKAYQSKLKEEYVNEGHKYQDLFIDHDIFISEMRYLENKGVCIPEQIAELIIEQENRGRSGLFLTVDETVVAGFFIESGIKQDANRIIEDLVKKTKAPTKAGVGLISRDNMEIWQDVIDQIGIEEVYSEVDDYKREQLIAGWLDKGERVTLIHSEKSPLYVSEQVLEITAMEDDMQVSSGITLISPDLSNLTTALSIGNRINYQLKQNLVITAILKVLAAILIIGKGLSLPQVAFIEVLNAFIIALNGIGLQQKHKSIFHR